MKSILGGGTGLAWMRMMGAESVGYHEHSVLERGDDRLGNALEYYASRGETPMVWGGPAPPRLAYMAKLALRSGGVSSASVALAIPAAESGSCIACVRGLSWSFLRTSQWPSWASSAGPRICT